MSTTTPNELLLDAPLERSARPKRSAGERLRRALLYAALILGALLMVTPFLFMLGTSLSPADEVFTYPPKLIPSSLHPENYWQLLTDHHFGRYFLNSMVITGVSTISVVLIDALAGYAFARLRFPGRTVMLVIVLATVMVPIQVTMIPLYIIMRHVPLAGGNDLLGAGGTGWLNTFPGLIAPTMATTFGIFIMRQAFQQMPGDLIEAARLDGCSEAKIFRRIYLPLAKPALATVGILTFTEVWNAFLWPLILVTSDSMRTLQLGVTSLKGLYDTQWQLLMAGVAVTAIPPFIVFLVGQRHFVRGVAMTGMKG